MKRSHSRILIAALAGIVPMFGYSGIVHGGTIIHTTDFDLATPVGTDGRGSGFGLPFSISGTYDTTQGWTWYTVDSTTNDDLTIPFGGGSATIGEQGIRVGTELISEQFSFGWGDIGTALGLRSQTYTDVAAGTANVSWTGTNAASANGFYAYFSQNGGTSWAALANGGNFAASVGSIEVVFVGNDGVNSETLLDAATISYQQVPEPGSFAMLLFGSIAALRLVGRKRGQRQVGR